MINLFFKKKVDSCNVEIEVNNVDECLIRKKADKYAAEQYNNKVTEQIKDDLMDKYRVNNSICRISYDSSYRERILVDYIIKDMAISLGLLKEVPNDK